MRIVKIDYNNPDPIIIKKVAQIIHEGKIAVVPGDAVYTIVGDAYNLDVLKKIYAIKKREKRKPFNLGLYSLEDIALYGEYTSLIPAIVNAFPDEPFTFVVPRKDSVPAYVNPGYDSLGFRIPFNKVTSMLSRFHRSPVIGTSANLSEFDNTYSVETLTTYFNEVFGNDIMPAIVLDAGRLPGRRPSTVLKIHDTKITVIREGEIEISSMEKRIALLQEKNKVAST